MFTSSELEGEVDHSFFDSDGDSGRNVGEKREKDLKMKKQIPSTLQRESVKLSGHLAVDLHSRTEKTKRHLKEVENKSGNKTDALSISFRQDEPIHEGKDELNLHSKRASGAFLTMTADIQSDGDNQRQNDTRISALAFPASSNEQMPRKLVKNQHPKNSPPTSNEASTDADSESSFSSQRGFLNSSNLSKPTESFVRRKTRGTRRGSAESQDLPNMSTDESDGSVTDVSPLSSPDSGSLQSLSSEAVKEGHKAQREPKTLPSGAFSNVRQAVDSNPDVDECSSGLESHLEQKMVLQISGGFVRKNFSFTDNEVRRIDYENKRLLQALSNISSRSRAEKLPKKNASVSRGASVAFYPHSAQNRDRQQRRIQQENLVLLKKLQSTQATPGLRRAEQLADHQRRTSMPSYRAFSGGSSRLSCAFIRPRPVASSAALINTYTNRTSVPGSSTRSSSRPSWR
ncbi:cilia- and flagella-associated protein 97 isoform X1 [Gambusia affinis]|uniref:cilia- and flagella-associated protein 97 isoform X1 n=1 Tax=Gambusia affinis TaxID=33528 RepID=UPI000F30DFD2|nr:cilia- and flagella-associated protein 97 isoform X1 [Gambusia affinis]